MVQWLRLHAPNAGGLSLIPGQGNRSHMPQLKDAACHNLKRQKDPVCRKKALAQANNFFVSGTIP